MVNPGFVADPQQQPQRQELGNGMAITGMVLGIAAIALCWIPVLPWPLALLGIIFSVLGIVRANKVGRGKGMAIAGLACAIAGGIAGTILSLLMLRSFDDYMAHSRSVDAEMTLHTMGNELKAYAAEHHEFPRGTAGPSPVGDCCKEPNGRCANSEQEWSSPVWQQIGFQFYARKTSYQYAYESSDGKTFVARAIGDLDCDGEKATYELRGSLDANGIPTTQLVRPPHGVY
jgi:hypothetical protein